MNCCHGDNHNHDKNHGKPKGMISHMLMMLICCGAPALLLLLLPLIGTKIPAVSSILVAIAPFICPLMMVPMMFMMFRKNKDSSNSHCEKNNSDGGQELIK